MVSPSTGDLEKKLYRVLCRDMMKGEGPDLSAAPSAYRHRIRRAAAAGGKVGGRRVGPMARRPIRRRLSLRGGRGPASDVPWRRWAGRNRLPPPTPAAPLHHHPVLAACKGSGPEAPGRQLILRWPPWEVRRFGTEVANAVVWGCAVAGAARRSLREAAWSLPRKHLRCGLSCG